jgi:bifunctional DNA-binding transcriptional regulator/antitoxin component of YhaV-PrlF toxin-antitoxin module
MTSPKAVLDGFGLKKGQKLQMVVKDDGIYIPLRENTTATITKDKVR